MKKYSILSLSLLTVSAIAAAFAPSKEPNGKTAINGRYTVSTNRPLFSEDFTCRRLMPEEEGEIEPNCSWTATGNNNKNQGFSSTSGLIFSGSVTHDQGAQTSSKSPEINVN